MAKKMMSGRIFFNPEYGDFEITRTSSCDRVEYIRADLVAGDPNEPLKEDQFRWVSVGGERHVARLELMLNDYDELELFFCTTDSCTRPKEELDFIGPVIRPPEDV